MITESKIKHLAITLDGNRRWASERGLPKLIGHTEGAKNLRKIAQAVQARGISYLTVYALSTENIKERSPEEVKYLFNLFEQLTKYLNDFLKHNARLNIIGNMSGLPEKTQRSLGEVMEKTKMNTDFTLTLAVNYGGRDEIVRAVRKAIAAQLPEVEITEERFSELLDTAGLPEVDLAIRTGGRNRLSNFLPWQTTYAEIYFSTIMWPAFSEEDLDRAIGWFEEQQRTKGK